ncbi:MAG: GNAT family N-acetyltransferase [Chloroflexia bacterium]|nr:GNAT family N-acetyltransferase [Chloroflexia bacterium]
MGDDVAPLPHGSDEPAEGESPSNAVPTIHRGVGTDAEAILRLQHLCYRSEALLYDDWTIPPLTETLAALRAEFVRHRILVARLGEKIVGSVRGRLDTGTCSIGRLVVHPDVRQRRLGSLLMAAIETEFAEAARFEVFTGQLSEDNLRLYRRLGYTETRRLTVSPRLTLVFLQKPAIG